MLNPPKLVTLESVFRANTAKRWKSRKKYIPSWEACQKFLYLRFVGQLQKMCSRNKGQRNSQEYLEHYYEAWKHVSHIYWVHRFVHIRVPVAVNRYMAGGLWHVTVARDKEIAQYRLSWVAQQAKGSKLTDWSQPLPGYAEEGPYCDTAAVPVVS